MPCFGALALSVDAGLVANQVVQCDAAGLGRFSMSGAAGAAGPVQARVMSGETEVTPWTQIATAENGVWQGAIEGVAAGGPYQVQVRVVDAAGAAVEEAAVADVLVGDLWILAGQSNMQGVGNLAGAEEPDPRVHVFAMNRTWRVAKDPLHVLAESPDPIHFDAAKTPEERQAAIDAANAGPKGAGLGLPFAKEMVRRTNRPVGLLATGHGGTSMAQWDPALRDQGGASLYGSMLTSVRAAGGVARGVIWYQGESDAGPEFVPVYREKLKALVASIRADLALPELPFYYVQISRFVHPDPSPETWNQIQMEELSVEPEIPNSAMVASIDLALDDLIHVGTPGLKTLGFRLASVAEHFLFGAPTLTGPRLEKIERVSAPEGEHLRVTFTNVNGGLQAQGRVSGFDLNTGPTPEPVQAIYKQEIAPDNPNAVLLWISKWPDTPHLWYGWGLNPYCNLVDAANMAVPAFGPIPVP
ncbi:MAG: sialate O-acetylesterase [Candidatus Hydrogenedentes bacterium]|nr:sialate O-acetylesterase [Candidatus Hydrogenedentota bacterium]